LRRIDHILACLDRPINNVFLAKDDLLQGHLHAQIPSGDHNAICSGNDIVDVLNSLVVFDFGDELNHAAVHGISVNEHLAQVDEVLSSTREGYGDLVAFVLQGEVHHVDHVCFRNCWERDWRPRQAHVLLLAHLAVRLHLDCDDALLDRLHDALHCAVGYEDFSTDFGGVGQVVVRAGDSLVVAEEAIVSGYN
jgi:hypothetical protein